MCNIITYLDIYWTPLKAYTLCSKIKGMHPEAFAWYQNKARTIHSKNPPHRALIINLLISVSQLLKMILGTTYWIFNLKIIDQIGHNGSEQWGLHVSWAGKADAQRKQWWQVLVRWVCSPRTWAPYWPLESSGLKRNNISPCRCWEGKR